MFSVQSLPCWWVFFTQMICHAAFPRSFGFEKKTRDNQSNGFALWSAKLKTMENKSKPKALRSLTDLFYGMRPLGQSGLGKVSPDQPQAKGMHYSQTPNNLCWLRLVKIQASSGQKLFQGRSITTPLGQWIYDHPGMRDPLNANTGFLKTLPNHLHLYRRTTIFSTSNSFFNQMIIEWLCIYYAQAASKHRISISLGQGSQPSLLRLFLPPSHLEIRLGQLRIDRHAPRKLT